MRKKYSTTPKDKKDWITFTDHLEGVYDKETDHVTQYTTANKIRKLDLHGLSLNQANKIVKKLVIKSFEERCKKLVIVTGKGLRSKVYENPYLSKQMNVLKYSVPEFIKNDKDLLSKISKISKADLKDGGEGAFYIFLKSSRNL